MKVCSVSGDDSGRAGMMQPSRWAARRSKLQVRTICALYSTWTRVSPVARAISIASASLMTDAIKGRTVDEAKALFDQFRHLVTEDDHGHAHDHDDLGSLVALGGVRQYPSRVKCATLAWHTMVSAAAGEAKSPVTTE